MDAPSYGFGYGDVVAVRVEPGFGVVDFSEVVATSTFEDVAVVDVDPRVSLTWAAWKRETFVFAGAVGLLTAAEGGVGDVHSAAGEVVDCSGCLSRVGPGVGGGEMNATFFWTSVIVGVVE